MTNFVTNWSLIVEWREYHFACAC